MITGIASEKKRILGMILSFRFTSVAAIGFPT